MGKEHYAATAFKFKGVTVNKAFGIPVPRHAAGTSIWDGQLPAPESMPHAWHTCSLLVLRRKGSSRHAPCRDLGLSSVGAAAIQSLGVLAPPHLDPGASRGSQRGNTGWRAQERGLG